MTKALEGHGTPEGAQKPQRKRGGRIRFWLLLLLGLLVLLPVVLVSAILLALRSETGTAWVINQIPGLEAVNDRGSLFGIWQADSLQWRGYGVDVAVESPFIDWSPSCLFDLHLCLETLQVEQLDVSVQPSEEGQSSSGDISLPELELPLGLRVNNVSLGTFTFNGSKVWDRFELEADGSGADWQLERVFYQLDDYTVTASGRVETRRDWPVSLEISANLPPPYGDAWAIDLVLSGSVRDLSIAGQSRGYLDATLEGEVQPLASSLPARVRVESQQFRAAEALPDTLVLNDWFVEASGSLQGGFKTQGQAMLEGTQGPIDLALAGLVTAAEARDIRLQLSTQDKAGKSPQTLVLAGNTRWQGGVSAQSDIQLRDFPWYSLLPGLNEPIVSLHTLDGSASWRDGRYQANLTAEVDGPQGLAELATVIEGDASQARLTEFSAVTGAGSLSGEGAVDFSGPLSWRAALEAKDFNPGYWVPVLEASLSGQVTTEGQLTDGSVPTMEASWDLEGQWRSSPTVAAGRLDTSTGAWVVPELKLVVGDNRLEGSGQWGEELQADLDLELPDPGKVLPGLGGKVELQLELTGTSDDPLGALSASATELRWQDFLVVDALSLDARLDSGFRLNTELQSKGISVAGQNIESLAVRVEGTPGEHEVAIDARREEMGLQLDFEGSAGDGWATWKGELAQGVIDLPGQEQSWVLEAPAGLEYGDDGELNFAAHCWRWQQSSVCADDQTLLPVPDIAYRINDFPAAALAPVLPETMRWHSDINGKIDFTSNGNGPDGRITLDAGKGRFALLLDGEWENLSYETLTTELDLKPDQADLAVRLSGPELGKLAVDMRLDPMSEDRQVEGSFKLSDLDIALAGLFTGLEEVAGEVNGEGTISGPLMRPAVHGEVALTNGHVVDPRLPLPMDEVVISVELDGYSADIRGRVSSNARSEAVIRGDIDWQDTPGGEVRITGERLPFSIEPYAHLEVAPDLTIAFRDGGLRVEGRIEVPRGDILIEALPAQAVSVSEDEVIVGVEQGEPFVRSINMDVTVVVGADQVTFAGFGVTGDLEGTLRIGNDMDARGTLQLVDGQYDAYGQELEIRQARLLFVGNLAQPYLDIEAVRQVDTVVAGIRLSGPIQSPTTEVFSSPDMPQSDALSYVILGRAPGGQADDGQMGRAAISLGLTQVNKVTGQIGEGFGIRELMLEAEGSGDQTSVVASGYLTDDLSIRYGVGIFEPISTVALRYDLGKYFYLEAASGLAASLDIFYTRDF
ncbi:translocation/assembly module TamB domain-containing protein [Marinobacter sp. 1_MG-2023]|uniref:translocation/assembly module TamB domain-containing protein n=1 Tax=Marinobacter sp. 1_MG-2023 TaxID=3062627 RepID=UPI0026E21BF0|nr:translocation/assembly module TamB domain-containing protein [Marinobacter sp. 1_MG-2023]MDO6823663.1 translocation/assembly module TamB domain-containing protein [Marinobacter sp. 1_MG-2023]